jgi:tetratricopeptide (TPR) repeat protein
MQHIRLKWLFLSLFLFSFLTVHISHSMPRGKGYHATDDQEMSDAGLSGSKRKAAADSTTQPAGISTRSGLRHKPTESDSPSPRIKRVKAKPKPKAPVKVGPDENDFFGPKGVLKTDLRQACFDFKEAVNRNQQVKKDAKCIICYAYPMSGDGTETKTHQQLMRVLRKNLRIGGIEAYLDLEDNHQDVDSFGDQIEHTDSVVLILSKDVVEKYRASKAKAGSQDRKSAIYREIERIKARIQKQNDWSFLHILALDDSHQALGEIFNIDGMRADPQWKSFITPKDRFFTTFNLIRGIYKSISKVALGLLPKLPSALASLEESELEELGLEYKNKLTLSHRKQLYKKIFNMILRQSKKPRGDDSRDPDAIIDTINVIIKRQIEDVKLDDLFPTARGMISTNTWKAAVAFKDMGLDFEAKGFYKLACAAYDKAAQLFTSTSGDAAISSTGFCKSSQGRLYYKHLVRTSEEEEVLNQDYQEAFHFFKEALDLNPSDAYAAYYLARLFMDNHITEASRGSMAGVKELLKVAVSATKFGDSEQFALHEKVRGHAQELLKKIG